LRFPLEASTSRGSINLATVDSAGVVAAGVIRGERIWIAEIDMGLALLKVVVELVAVFGVDRNLQNHIA
jgi:hypothetical protein